MKAGQASVMQPRTKTRSNRFSISRIIIADFYQNRRTSIQLNDPSPVPVISSGVQWYCACLHVGLHPRFFLSFSLPFFLSFFSLFTHRHARSLWVMVFWMLKPSTWQKSPIVQTVYALPGIPYFARTVRKIFEGAETALRFALSRMTISLTITRLSFVSPCLLHRVNRTTQFNRRRPFTGCRRNITLYLHFPELPRENRAKNIAISLVANPSKRFLSSARVANIFVSVFWATCDIIIERDSV